MKENKSMICVKENIFTKMLKFIKNILSKRKKKQEIKIETCSNTNNIRQKSELLSIYNKAKKGKYDLNTLEIEEIKMLNKLIEAEIEIKTKKLDEIITETKMMEYALTNK